MAIAARKTTLAAPAPKAAAGRPRLTVVGPTPKSDRDTRAAAENRAVLKEITDRMEFLRGACATDLAVAMDALSNGDLSIEITPKTPLLDIPEDPDLALMAETFNALRNQTVKSVEAYNRARAVLSELALNGQEIAGGNLKVDVKPKSDKDVLGNVFLKMVTDLSAREEEESIRTAEYKASVKEIADRMEFLRGACATDLATAMQALSVGDLSFTIEPKTPLLDIPKDPDLAVMAETFNALRNQTVKSVEAYNRAQITLNGLAATATEIAAGNLTVDAKPQSEKDVLGNAFATMITNLSALVAQARSAADTIAQASGEVSAGTDDLSQRTEEQASSLEETASSMEELTSTVKQNADNAKQANQLAIQAREVAVKGGEVVGNAVGSMEEISVASKKIADIISVIDEIAFQTNLLALNAAVEAARVGEQGRGFAVVAAEVRNLAGRSATAAKEIKALVQDSVQKVQDGSSLVNQSGQTLQEIVQSVNKVADIIAEISAACQEQASGIEQVNKAVTEMDQITQQNAALVEETAAASRSTTQQATDLQSVVGKFQLSQSYLTGIQQQAMERKAAQLATAKAASSRGHSAVSSRSAKTPSRPIARRTSSSSDEFEEF